MFPLQLTTILLLFCSLQHQVYGRKILANFSGGGAKCNVATDHYDCCYYIQKPVEIDLCVALDYLPDEYGVELRVILNNLNIIDEKLSLRNPPPICEKVVLEKLAEVCFYFYNLNVNKTEVDLCMKVDFELLRKDILDVSLGCYKIPIGLWSNGTVPLIHKSEYYWFNSMTGMMHRGLQQIGISDASVKNSFRESLGLVMFSQILLLTPFALKALRSL